MDKRVLIASALGGALVEIAMAKHVPLEVYRQQPKVIELIPNLVPTTVVHPYRKPRKNKIGIKRYSSYFNKK